MYLLNFNGIPGHTWYKATCDMCKASLLIQRFAYTTNVVSGRLVYSVHCKMCGFHISFNNSELVSTEQNYINRVSISGNDKPSGAEQLSVIFSEKQYSELDNLATLQGITLEEAVQQSIDVSSLVINTMLAKPDGKITIKRENSPMGIKIVS